MQYFLWSHFYCITSHTDLYSLYYYIEDTIHSTPPFRMIVAGDATPARQFSKGSGCDTASRKYTRTHSSAAQIHMVAVLGVFAAPIHSGL